MSDNVPFKDRIDQLIDSTDQRKVNQLYAEWSKSYDDDLVSYGYVAPKIATEIFAKTVTNKNALIHDAGCGTGLVGALLHLIDYKKIHGSDYSQEMLAQARNLNIYDKLESADFSKPLDIKSGTYDGVISVGVYSSRFKEIFLPQMLKILKPGGHFLFSCREQFFDEVSATIKALHEQSTICESTYRLDNYLMGQNAKAFYITLRAKQE